MEQTTINIPALGGEFNRTGDATGLRIWEDLTGRMWATGLFYMHDTKGFPLACSLDYCAGHDLTPCLGDFAADAAAAGWDRERADRVIKEAVKDLVWIPPSWSGIVSLRPYLPGA